MRFGILGATTAWRPDGQPVAIGGPRLRALLARLLLDAGRTVPVDRLVDDLYGERPPKKVANALQSQVSRLRQVLPDHPVELRPGGYRLAVDPAGVDAHRFGELAAAGRRALAAGDHRSAVALLGQALALWRGPALADVATAPYAPAQAARLEEARLAAVEDRAEAALALGEAAPLVPELRDLVAAHPLRERSRALLIRALYAGGRSAEALAVFEDGRRRLADEFGVDPSPALAAAHLAVLRGEPPHPASPATAPVPDARPTGESMAGDVAGFLTGDGDRVVAGGAAGSAVPAQLTSFVGREEELRRIDELLTEARLVTITGPGGVGKTRLAVEAAARRAGEVRFVALDPVAGGAEVPRAVLTALGLRDAGLREAVDRRPDPVERILAALADRRVLLVLDNCEHVVADVAKLAARLLGGCPDLRILATSRQALGVTGEALCPLPGLATPPAGVSAGAATAYPAVRLLAERAAAVSPGFTVDGTNVAAVGRICRMLDGLPLAIELAAARLRVLSPEQVAARLDDRFRLLSRGSRAAQPRHQTLRAVVGWSWDLLDDAEQTLARRLTVFAGGASLAAVERVCGVPADDAVELLTSLVDKSLVDVAGGRFRMLETIRAFGAERLAEAGETERLRHAHAAYFLDLAETADPHLRRAEQVAWLDRLDAERDNLHAALRRATADARWDTALRLVCALAFYWWLRGLRGEAAHLAYELRSALGPTPPPGREEEFLLCDLLASLGRPGRATGVRRHVLSEVERAPRQPFLFYLSAIASGPPSDDVDVLLGMVERVRRLADPWLAALAPVGVGLLLTMRGETERAEAMLSDALAGFRALGDRWGAMVAVSGLAEVATARGDRRRATALWREALTLAEQLGSTMDVAELLHTRALADLRPDADLDRARRDFERALTLARPAGALEHVAAARCGLAEVARLRGDLPGARRLAEQALAECPTGWFAAEGTRVAIHLCLGRIAEAAGEPVAARESYRRALAASRRWWHAAAEAEAAAALRRLEAYAAGA